MAITRTFQDMLNDYLPTDVLVEVLVKRDYLLSNIERDDSWVGAGGAGGASAGVNSEYIVPFKGAQASSIEYGALTADTDIADDKFVRGRIGAQIDVWGTMQFHHRDLMEHGKVSEKRFLKILPDSIEDFVDYLKGVISVNLLNGSWFAKATADGAVGGTIVVDRPDRFTIGQKVTIDDDNSTAITDSYVTAINMNTKTITIQDDRTGGAAVDLSSMTLAQNTKFYTPGANSAAFVSLRGALLSLANGGDTNLYGVAKTAYPYLQAINVDGASVTATNILQKVFDALTEVRKYGKGAPRDVIMSYKNYGSCIKSVESSKGAFNVRADSTKASPYGWDEIMIGSVAKGSLKLVGVQEMDDDIIIFLDWRAVKFASNGFIQKVKSPDGLEYYVKRATTGYTYVIDMCCFGELVVHRPSYCGIMYGISYS